MGIGRREFLLQFGGAIATLASLGRAAAFVEDLYVDRHHGLAFHRPAGWTFESLMQTSRVKEGMLLDVPGFDHERWAAFIREDTKYSPFVVVADMARGQPIPGWQGTGDPDALAPGISAQFEGTWEHGGPDPSAPFSLLAYVKRDLFSFADVYRRFQVVRAPEARQISGCEAVEYWAAYEYRHRQTPLGAPMRERVLYVHQDPAIYSIRMWDYPELPKPIVHDFDSFIPTIHVL